MEDVLKKLKAMTDAFARDGRPVRAAALLQPANVPPHRWHVIVAGDWVEAGRSAPKRYLRDALAEHLAREERLKVNVALPLRPEHPVVQDLARAVARHGGAGASSARELRNLELNGMEMDRAYVVTFDDALLGATSTTEQAA